MSEPTKDELIYLASLYSLEAEGKPWILEKRYQRVMFVSAVLMKEGWKILSPITHCHPMSYIYDLPKTWDFWNPLDKCYISHCDRVVILGDYGIDRSKGITGERKIAKELGKPLSMLYWYDGKDMEDYSYRFAEIFE